jgi:hypothetical protein
MHQDELERIWKKEFMAYYLGISLERQRKSTINIVKDRPCPRRDSNRAFPE